MLIISAKFPGATVIPGVYLFRSLSNVLPVQKQSAISVVYLPSQAQANSFLLYLNKIFLNFQ